MDSETKQYVDSAIKSSQKDARYGTSNASYHTHNGLDSPKLAPQALTSGVSQIIAGTNVTVSPAGGTGAVTVNAALSSAVSSVTGSGAGINVSPTTGAVVVSNTGVTSLVAGTNITLSGATGAVTVNASSGGAGSATGTDTLTGATPPVSVTHTITHGLGVIPAFISAEVPEFNAPVPSGSGTNFDSENGWLYLNGSGVVVGGFTSTYHITTGGAGTRALTQASSGPSNIASVGNTSGGTGTASVTINNITTTTFDIVYVTSAGVPSSYSFPTISWLAVA